MNFAIVEDLKTDMLHLQKLLISYLARYDFSYEIDCFNSGEAFLAHVQPDYYDLCFMDIYMDGINGMDTAIKLKNIDPACRVIFLTTSTDYITEGYRIRAWRYLLKPLTIERLAEALPECIEKSLLATRRLHLVINRQTYDIPFSKIWYITTADRSIEIHSKDRKIVVGRQLTFDELTASLTPDFRFIVLNRGLIANLHYAKSIVDCCLVMQNDIRLPISRRKITEISEAFVRFRFEH